MKKVIVYCYNRCTTCKKAIKYLEENIAKNKNIELELKDIITEKPNLNEMIKIIEIKYNKKISEIKRDELKSFFNTSGILYRENNIKDKIKDEKNSIEDILNILISDGKMIKRPLVIVNEENDNKNILLGFKEEEYKNIF
ncbi:MAG: glutaredoxin family protein [Clostridiales bacterium]|nr:glutaredoxin family protein [Clostridiales bacterium]